MRIQFLGTGAATAYPLPFCRCEACQMARQGGKNFRLRASVLVDGALLIDLNPDLMAATIMQGADASQIQYWLQTHSHSDHFDPGHLITRIAEYATVDPNPLTLVASPACIRHMSEKLAREEDGATLEDEVWKRRLCMHVLPMRHGERVTLGRYRVWALESLHDVGDQSMIYLISDGEKSLLYATDTGDLSGNAYALLRGEEICLDALILDHTYGGCLGVGDSGHLNAKTFRGVLDHLRAMGTIDDKTRIYATHISHEGNPPHDAFEQMARKNGYAVAYDGLTLVL